MYEDFLFEEKPHPILSNDPAPPIQSFYSTPVTTAPSPWTPCLVSSSASLLRNSNPFAAPALMNATASISNQVPMADTNRKNVSHVRPDDLHQYPNPVCYRDRFPVPTYNYTPPCVPPARWTSANDVADRPSSLNNSKLPYSGVEHKTPLPASKPTCSPLEPLLEPPLEPPPRPTSVVNSPQDNILTMVASAMEN